ncbi:hypothetical protein E3N88_02897 [Mikania micrantha]|uniref:Uncharacterized protein n=1 Tax=Mikania micrantha TaxID=192012 RepID=A0A5N6Q752_9ASTR|nr:hypothetical protein E3N88_02897 [Mikania micrantha]
MEVAAVSGGGNDGLERVNLERFQAVVGGSDGDDEGLSVVVSTLIFQQIVVVASAGGVYAIGYRIRALKEAEANKLMLTPQFLELKFVETISNNTKMFFGNKIPSMVLDQRLLGNFLQDLEGRKNLEA